jgi:hypothetical protein
MENMDVMQTIGDYIVSLTKIGITFSDTLLKKKWGVKQSPDTDPNQVDNNRKAAWHLYVEMETRIITQPLPPGHGDEKTALKSVYSLFPITRDILHAQGPDCVEFAKIAIKILNQEVRWFTAKWHPPQKAGAFRDPTKCTEFRDDLEKVQKVLRAYICALARLAGVEDTDSLSNTEQE